MTAIASESGLRSFFVLSISARDDGNRSGVMSTSERTLMDGLLLQFSKELHDSRRTCFYKTTLLRLSPLVG